MTLVIGVYHGRTGASNPIGMHNARAWARWVGARYRDARGVIWSMYPRAEPASLGVARELARGLREGDGGAHLVSLHPDPSPASSSLFHRERWLAFNTIQTYKFVERVVPLIEADRARRPRKPVVMAEGAYEAGIEYGFPVTPLWVRRQAYYSFLAGASHGYGHNDCWRAWPSWEQALEAPGAAQLGVLRRAITGRREWWRLEPDPSLIREGAWHVGDVLTLAARHPGGDWLLFYLADRFECVVDLGRAGPARLPEGFLDRSALRRAGGGRRRTARLDGDHRAARGVGGRPAGGGAGGAAAGAGRVRAAAAPRLSADDPYRRYQIR